MKWLFLILGYFLRPLTRMTAHNSDPGIDIKQLVVDNAKKVLLAITLTSVLSSMFVGGAVISVITMAAQYDQNAGIGISAMLLGGFGLMAISLLMGWILFSPSREGREADRQEERERIDANNRAQIHGHQGVSDALVLLINDFIKEREFKRAKEAQTMTQQASSVTPEEAYYGNRKTSYSDSRENIRH